MTDVMLDFETLGNGKSKCLIQVGAVYFDNVTGELGKPFKANIDPESHVKRGGVIDASTVIWWMQQSREAQASVLIPGRDVKEVMTELNDFFKDAKRIWSHATFDFVTLNDTLRDLDIKPSYSYKSGMDLRTLVYLSGKEVQSVKRDGVAHDALDDCIYQVKYCVAALNAVKTNKKLIKLLESTRD